MIHFFQVVLRTSDVEAARSFYGAVLGEGPFQVVQLHEQAVARGARPHWLGFLAVPDVEQAAASFCARGAVALGPKWVNPEGLEAMTLRDPGGAVIALGKPPAHARVEAHDKNANAGTSAKLPGPDVIWHGLNTNDVERAKVNYGKLFGWAFGQPLDLGSLGVLHPFAWQRGGTPVGSMGDIKDRAGVHPHWLFHFRVAALETALQAVRNAGGTVLDPVTLPGGARVAVCDDPQGAAFALCEDSQLAGDALSTALLAP